MFSTPSIYQHSVTVVILCGKLSGYIFLKASIYANKHTGGVVTVDQWNIAYNNAVDIEISRILQWRIIKRSAPWILIYNVPFLWHTIGSAPFCVFFQYLELMVFPWSWFALVFFWLLNLDLLQNRFVLYTSSFCLINPIFIGMKNKYISILQYSLFLPW